MRRVTSVLLRPWPSLPLLPPPPFFRPVTSARPSQREDTVRTAADFAPTTVAGKKFDQFLGWVTQGNADCCGTSAGKLYVQRDMRDKGLLPDQNSGPLRTGSDDEIRLALTHPKVYLLDARRPDEFASSRLPHSLNIPHSSLRDLTHRLPLDKTTPIVAYCASGNRVKTALGSLNELGYTNVLNGTSLDRMKEFVR